MHADQSLLSFERKIFLFASFIAALGFAGVAGAVEAYCPSASHQEPANPPSQMIPAITKALQLEADTPSETLYVRCVGRKLMACSVGANLNCFKADKRRELPGATEYCRDNPDSTDIPMAVTGHDTIYAWSCKESKAVAGKSLLKVDPQGYVSDNWKPAR